MNAWPMNWRSSSGVLPAGQIKHQKNDRQRITGIVPALARVCSSGDCACLPARVCNFSRCGYRATDFLAYHKSGAVQVRGADVIIIMLGTNGGHDPEKTDPAHGSLDHGFAAFAGLTLQWAAWFILRSVCL